MSEQQEPAFLERARAAMGSAALISERALAVGADDARVQPTRPMQIHRVRGRDLVEALQRAARQYGDDVLVLSREPAPGGGVTVAVGRAGARPAARAPRPASAPRAPGDPGSADVARRLERSGASPQLVRRVLAAVAESGAQGAFAIDAAAAALGTLISRAPSPKLRRAARAPHVIAFVGPTGVGKTTTLVKLASRLVRGGRRVALVSTDTRSVAGTAQLETYGKLLQCPVLAAEDGLVLARSIAQSRSVDVVLVDTGGRSPSEGATLARLADELRPGADASGFDVYLTLTATAGRSSLEETRLGFEAARPGALVLTKLDETREPAHVLEFAAGSGLPVAFLCDGPEIAAHLLRPTPDACADLFLRGRLA